MRETVAKLTLSHSLATWQNLPTPRDMNICTALTSMCAGWSSADCICTYWQGLNWIRQSWHNLTPSSEVIIMIHYTAQQCDTASQASQVPRNRQNKRRIKKKKTFVYAPRGRFTGCLTSQPILIEFVATLTSGLENDLWIELKSLTFDWNFEQIWAQVLTRSLIKLWRRRYD